VSHSAAPAGYVEHVDASTRIVSLAAEAAAVVAARDASGAAGTLYYYARAHPERRALHGRAPVYAVRLPLTGTRVVVRHGWHGGLLAPVTGDRFLPPTRAPHELRAALRLADAGVPTPEIVAYAIYRAPLGMRRTDVLSREVPDSADLAALLAPDADDGTRAAALAATAELLRALAGAGARHPDLNAKNILVSTHPAPGTGLRAHVLDVDRVLFEQDRAAIARANSERLVRSLRKLRAAGRVEVLDTDLASLARSGHPHAAGVA
jgi:hypothetical protein